MLVGYSEYHASGDDASTFGAAGTAQTFNANVIEYKYTITFYNGSEVNGIFYYSDATTFDKLLTGMPNFVAFSYKGTAYDIHDESDAAALLKAFSNVLYPAKDGYKATQWKDADGNVMLDKVTKTTMSSKELNTDIPVITYDVNFKKISSDMNFYANFEAEKYAIIYSGNTAAATNNMVQIGTVDGALTLFKDSTFTNDGYKLMGWNTRPDGDGTSYKLGESFTLNGAQFEDLSSVKGITNVPADITYGFMLYAIWEKVGSSDNPSGNSGGDDDNTNTYLLAGILVVIIILIIVVAVILRKKN